jgi:hypothetical protein
MRVVALVFGILGVIGIVMGILTAVEVAPAFISGGPTFGTVAYTSAFWWGLAALLLLTSIAFSIGSWGTEQ